MDTTLRDISALSDSELRELADRFPFFDIPHILLLDRGYRTSDRMLLRSLFLRRSVPAEAAAEDAETESDTISIIDSFLACGEHRIADSGAAGDEDAAAAAGSGMPDSMVSEELADIYLRQGMTEEAVAMYRKLSLRNPKKSVYFAELISEAQNKANNQKK